MGSDDATSRARAYCRDVLAAHGFRLREQPFEYSALVGKYGTPLGGVFAVAVVGTAALAGARARGTLALTLLILALPLLALAGRWLAAHGVLVLPALRRRGVNLEGRRLDDEPLLWLVAHIDSKSQPVPLLVRAGGIIVLSAAWIAALLLAGAQVAGSATSPSGWKAIALLAFVGALPVMASTVGAKSPGAIDNASGVAAVLTAAAILPHDARVGILITDAEELGLAGARAWCAGRARGAALNCDGVDDAGSLTLMWTRPRSARLERALRSAAEEEGQPLRIIPLIPGVLVDGVAFADGGWEVATVSRGTLRTLRRIHTSRDNVRAVRGEGIALTGRVLARAALTLVGSV